MVREDAAAATDHGGPASDPLLDKLVVVLVTGQVAVLAHAPGRGEEAIGVS